MLLRVLKTLLRASPWLLGLLFTMYLILIHGPRLAVDGHVPLAALVVRLLLCGALLLVAVLVVLALLSLAAGTVRPAAQDQSS